MVRRVWAVLVLVALAAAADDLQSMCPPGERGDICRQGPPDPNVKQETKEERQGRREGQRLGLDALWATLAQFNGTDHPNSTADDAEPMPLPDVNHWGDLAQQMVSLKLLWARYADDATHLWGWAGIYFETLISLIQFSEFKIPAVVEQMMVHKCEYWADIEKTGELVATYLPLARPLVVADGANPAKACKRWAKATSIAADDVLYGDAYPAFAAPLADSINLLVAAVDEADSLISIQAPQAQIENAATAVAERLAKMHVTATKLTNTAPALFLWLRFTREALVVLELTHTANRTAIQEELRSHCTAMEGGRCRAAAPMLAFFDGAVPYRTEHERLVLRIREQLQAVEGASKTAFA